MFAGSYSQMNFSQFPLSQPHQLLETPSNKGFQGFWGSPLMASWTLKKYPNVMLVYYAMSSCTCEIYKTDMSSRVWSVPSCSTHHIGVHTPSFTLCKHIHQQGRGRFAKTLCKEINWGVLYGMITKLESVHVQRLEQNNLVPPQMMASQGPMPTEILLHC